MQKVKADQASKESIPEYDFLRIILVLLVVLGHSAYYRIATDYGGVDYSNLVGDGCAALSLIKIGIKIIYLFHMPCFMALSGALFYRTIQKKKYENIKQIIRDKGKRLLIPFITVTILYSVPLKIASGYYVESSNIVSDIFIGQVLLQGNSHLWYLATLFFIFIIAFCLEINNLNRWIKFSAVVLAYLLSGLSNIILLNYILEYLLWFYMGYYFEPLREKINCNINGHFTLYVFAATVCCGILYFCIASEYMILRLLRAGLKLVLISLMCLCIYIIAYLLSKTGLLKNRLLKAILDDSMGIYLYSDSWNYVLLSVVGGAIGANLYTSNFLVTIFVVGRFGFTLMISILITEILKILNLKYWV